MGALLGLIPVFNELISLFPTAEQRAAAANKIQDAELAIATAQAQIDQAEATNASFFVSGWRPFIGWVCGLGFTYSFAGPIFGLPAIDTSAMYSILGGMLGLGTLRTFEKVNSKK